MGSYLRHSDRQEIFEMERQDSENTQSGARLRDFRMCDREKGTAKTCFRSGEAMVVHFDYEKEPDIKALTFSFSISLGDEKSYVSCHSPCISASRLIPIPGMAGDIDNSSVAS